MNVYELFGTAGGKLLYKEWPSQRFVIVRPGALFNTVGRFMSFAPGDVRGELESFGPELSNANSTISVTAFPNPAPTLSNSNSTITSEAN